MLKTGDSRTYSPIPNWADFLYTCSPYYDLEEYGGPAGDLSMMGTYQLFLAGLGDVVAQTARTLKPGALSCWVIGLHRDKHGTLLPLHHDLTAIHNVNGFTLKEEVILAQRNNGAIQRDGNFDKGQRRLIRTHEYLMV